MSTTLKALISKFVITGIAALIAFYATSDFTWIIVVSLLGTTLNYLVGDLLVLPNFGNVLASIGDGSMAAITAYIVDLIAPAFDVTTSSLVLFGLLVAVGEYFFHIYLKRSKKVAP
ncbi:DUF2512 family protein [Halothermothrix orenii]|uniref:DUF2512 family protein n=1 Tax=Halothermothrix orenii (strain H 168 / OCM 544 / DSM 9562) TaxID=373903 RepID=B8CYE6_HALOH|nr:DUF2512 family protein [Halothermothrix orenii]ACL70315.1 hypothetical protein Hore_15660 [Halothermothrix orenii H 168]